MTGKPTTVLAVLAFTAGGLVAGLPAQAAADTSTNVEHHATETFRDVVPCVGPGRITITYNEVEHEAANAQTFHFTFTQTGRFNARLGGGGTSSGRFIIWGGGNFDTSGEHATVTFTFSGGVRSGVGAGTKWNSVSHFTGPVDENGDPKFDLAKVAFDRFRCH